MFALTGSRFRHIEFPFTSSRPVPDQHDRMPLLWYFCGFPLVTISLFKHVQFTFVNIIIIDQFRCCIDRLYQVVLDPFLLLLCIPILVVLWICEISNHINNTMVTLYQDHQMLLSECQQSTELPISSTVTVDWLATKSLKDWTNTIRDAAGKVVEMPNTYSRRVAIFLHLQLSLRVLSKRHNRRCITCTWNEIILYKNRQNAVCRWD